MPKGNRKGSSFERKICKLLSKWWTDGERDDVFWRSSQSGGRATQRAKSGKKTFGSYGDIAAVDPIGQPLMQLFTIELKRGKHFGDPDDLLDFEGDNCARGFCKALTQAIRSHQEAGSQAWLLIGKRDCRVPLVFIPHKAYIALGNEMDDDVWQEVTAPPLVRYKLRLAKQEVDFVAMPFEKFLRHFEPEHVKTVVS